MPKHTYLLGLAIVVFASSQAVVGCSSEPEKKLPPAASKADVMKGDVTRANKFLDALEDMDPDQRASTANGPRMALTLKTASSDPGVKKRIADLGIELK